MSSSLPLHPMLVHVPLALAALMPLVSVGFLVAWWRGWLPERGWLVVVALQAILAGGGWLAMRTGGQEEDRVERITGERAIHRHEEAAETFTWTAFAVLGISVLPLLLRGRAALAAGAATTAGAIAVLALGVQAGERGAELVYQHNAGAAYAAPAGTPSSMAVPSRGDGDGDGDADDN